MTVADDENNTIATAVALERAFRMLDENDWAWDFMMERDPAKELLAIEERGKCICLVALNRPNQFLSLSLGEWKLSTLF